ncbi:MAG: hypothetical protein K9W44_15570 [Candidatus Lokiarchaeota archaeon]|nr:hypothetical protein [Candidatus Harpocratesius repetitus]
MNISEKEVQKALELALENSVIKKDGKPDKIRKFDESVDLIINIRDVDIKNPNNRIDNEILLPHPIPNNLTKDEVCFIVKDQMELDLKESGYHVLNQNDLNELQKKSKKEKKEVAKKFKYFVARADLMRDLARVLARFLGQQGKMPRPQPKGFGVIRPNEDLGNYLPLLNRIVKISMKKQLLMQLKVGKKSQSKDELMDNIKSVLNFIEGQLPVGNNNVRSIYLKTTMGKPIMVKEAQKGGRR